MGQPNVEGTTNPTGLGGNVFGTSSSASVNPVTVANGGTVTLDRSQSFNVLRPTGDATIAGAVINFPAYLQFGATALPTDGTMVTVVSTGQITAVTGTVHTQSLPVISEFLAGTQYSFIYNAAANIWFSLV